MGLTGWPALVEGQVGVDVVEVAGPRPTAAAGEDAGPVAKPDHVGHPCGRIGAVARAGRRGPGAPPAAAGRGAAPARDAAEPRQGPPPRGRSATPPPAPPPSSPI